MCAGPEAKRNVLERLGRMLGAIGCAAALALAAVLAFAAIVAALAATLALAVILTLTGVLAGVLIERGAAERRFARLEHGVRGSRSRSLQCCSSAQQTRNCRSNHQGLHRMLHCHSSMSGPDLALCRRETRLPHVSAAAR